MIDLEGEKAFKKLPLETLIVNDLFLWSSIASNPKLRELCLDSLVTKSMLESANPNYGYQASVSSCWDLLKSLILSAGI